MSQLKLTADGGGGTVAIKAPASTTGNAAIELTLPGTGNSTLLTSASDTGKILQVKQTVQSGRVSEALTNDTYTDISGLSLNITPAATDSKMLVSYHLGLCTNSGTYNVMTRIMRGSTPIGIGDLVGSYRQRATNVGWTTNNYQMVNYDNMYLDDRPNGTSQITYKLQWTNSYDGQTVYLNRVYSDGDSKYYPTTISHITVMEVAA